MDKKTFINYLLIFFLLIISFSSKLAGQCILANPSFEIEGSEGNIFAGWNQFGSVDSDSIAVHGFYAAKCSGPNFGSWDMSAFWQRLDCEIGEQWEVTGFVKHSSSSPLTGSCIAIVNVEWRDAVDGLIDYDSFTVADASASTDEFVEFSLTSSPAPTGTVATHILVGVLQSPSDPPPDAYFDQLTFYSTAYPTIDNMQWDDFPDGRTINFADQIWRVKGSGWYAPGPNNFSHLQNSVWIDIEDRLHLTIKNISGTWYSTEIVLEEALGYGDYIFSTIGSLDQLDINAVLGLFLWQYGPCWDPDNLWWNPYNEFDIEFSRWGNVANQIGQFVAQPWDYEGNINRFDVQLDSEELSSHAFKWLPDRVECRSWRGGPDDESPGNMIHEWTYTGPHIPRPEQPRVHMNLWKLGGIPSTDQEVIIDDFTFIPKNELIDPIEDLTILISEPTITLLWTAIDDASYYHIYESSTPNGPWTKIITCESNSQDLVISGDKKFYYVAWE